MKKIGLVILGIGVLLIGIISFSKEEKKVLVEEEINNSNTSLVFMLQDKEGNYNKSEELPSSGYSFNTSKSVCSNNTTPTWEDNKLYLNNLSKNGTSCYLYFDVLPLAKETILANSKVNEGTPDFSQVATTDEGTYKAEDDWGDSYYFRGAVENNYVKFAGYYWRIIRINGDGSIRIIYDGTSAHANGESSDDRQIGNTVYNNLRNDNAYVGYMYTSGQVHGLETDSTIKGVLDDWYTTNIANKGYGDKISKEAGFCGDREPSTSSSSSNGAGGTGTIATYYGGYIRLVNDRKEPILKCNSSADLYTVSGSNKGNKALTNPIGLITADEIGMSGAVWNINNYNYFLYTGNTVWSISPSYSEGWFNTRMFLIDSNGWLSSDYVDSIWGIRPVINIASDVTLSGTGTANDPYIVEGAE